MNEKGRIQVKKRTCCRHFTSNEDAVAICHDDVVAVLAIDELKTKSKGIDRSTANSYGEEKK